MNLIFLFLAIEIFSGLITFNFYKKAGRQAWEAFVPFYRVVILLKIIERPWWWVILCYLPVVGNVMAVVVVFELLHVFNYRKLFHTFLAILTFGLYLGYLNFTAELKYVGRDFQDIRRHVSELVASLIFAVVAATVIRAYTFEAFTIPTPSMEKSLMVGDFLFVSKLQYGSRPPLTPLSLPLVHNKIPFTQSFKEFGYDSYLDWPQLPYWRFPKFSDVERGDPVVFNYPAEDIRPINMEGKVRPIDKREHYVKRCVAIPGDTLRVIDGKVNVDGKELEMPFRVNPQISYFVRSKGPLNGKMLKEKYDINFLTPRQQQEMGDGGAAMTLMENQATGEYSYQMNIPEKQLEAFKNEPNVKMVYPLIGRKNLADYPEDVPAFLKDTLYARAFNADLNDIGLRRFVTDADLFPNPKPIGSSPFIFKWTRDNYGPLYIPKEGATIKLNKENLYKYNRIITAYEHNILEVKGGKVYINGAETNTYTFKQGYYWMMGDNRHASDDSRYWGFVPEDHIVGKPVFIWMSYDKFGDGLMDKIRFDRVFTTVSGDGPRTSYFWPFVVVVVLIYGFNKWNKKRKQKAEA